MLFAEACVAVAIGYALARAWRLARPVIAWVSDGEDPPAAWRVAVALPRQLVARGGWQPLVIIGLPTSIFVTLKFDLPAYSALIIFTGAMLAVAARRPSTSSPPSSSCAP